MFIAGIEIFFGLIAGAALLILTIIALVCGATALKVIRYKLGKLIPQYPADGFTSQPAPPKTAAAVPSCVQAQSEPEESEPMSPAMERALDLAFSAPQRIH